MWALRQVRAHSRHGVSAVSCTTTRSASTTPSSKGIGGGGKSKRGTSRRDQPPNHAKQQPVLKAWKPYVVSYGEEGSGLSAFWEPRLQQLRPTDQKLSLSQHEKAVKTFYNRRRQVVASHLRQRERLSQRDWERQQQQAFNIVVGDAKKATENGVATQTAEEQQAAKQRIKDSTLLDHIRTYTGVRYGHQGLSFSKKGTSGISQAELEVLKTLNADMEAFYQSLQPTMDKEKRVPLQVGEIDNAANVAFAVTLRKLHGDLAQRLTAMVDRAVVQAANSKSVKEPGKGADQLWVRTNGAVWGMVSRLLSFGDISRDPALQADLLAAVLLDLSAQMPNVGLLGLRKGLLGIFREHSAVRGLTDELLSDVAQAMARTEALVKDRVVDNTRTTGIPAALLTTELAHALRSTWVALASTALHSGAVSVERIMKLTDVAHIELRPRDQLALFEVASRVSLRQGLRRRRKQNALREGGESLGNPASATMNGSRKVAIQPLLDSIKGLIGTGQLSFDTRMVNCMLRLADSPAEVRVLARWQAQIDGLRNGQHIKGKEAAAATPAKMEKDDFVNDEDFVDLVESLFTRALQVPTEQTWMLLTTTQKLEAAQAMACLTETSTADIAPAGYGNSEASVLQMQLLRNAAETITSGLAVAGQNGEAAWLKGSGAKLSRSMSPLLHDTAVSLSPLAASQTRMAAPWQAQVMNSDPDADADGDRAKQIRNTATALVDPDIDRNRIITHRKRRFIDDINATLRTMLNLGDDWRRIASVLTALQRSNYGYGLDKLHSVPSTAVLRRVLERATAALDFELYRQLAANIVDNGDNNRDTAVVTLFDDPRARASVEASLRLSPGPKRRSADPGPVLTDRRLWQGFYADLLIPEPKRHAWHGRILDVLCRTLDVKGWLDTDVMGFIGRTASDGALGGGMADGKAHSEEQLNKRDHRLGLSLHYALSDTGSFVRTLRWLSAQPCSTEAAVSTAAEISTYFRLASKDGLAVRTVPRPRWDTILDAVLPLLGMKRGSVNSSEDSDPLGSALDRLEPSVKVLAEFGTVPATDSEKSAAAQRIAVGFLSRQNYPSVDSTALKTLVDQCRSFVDKVWK